jgi:lipid-binding SYLF domain-containing protein
MKQKNYNRALAVFGMIAALSAYTAQAADDLQKRSQEAVAAFLKVDPTLKTFIDGSAGYAVFPHVGKGGLIVGGAHGEGQVFEKGNVTGKAKMTQASIGAQVGGQTFAEIIFFETPAALDDFKGGKFEMSAEVSAVAAAEGASKAAKYKRGVAVFTLPEKGLMVQASIGGQKFKFEPIAAGGTGPSQGTEKGKGTETP